MYPWQQYAADPRYSQKIALWDEQGKSFTWAQVAQLVAQCAYSLQQQGVHSQSGIALCGKNSFELLLFYLAGLQAGARVLGINPAFSDQKIEQICLENQLSFYVSADSRQISEKLTALKLDVVYRAIYVPSSLFESFPKADFQRPVLMTLTSGSSGRPKAVVHNLQAYLDNAAGVCELLRFSTQDTWLFSLPLYHVSGQGIIWRWLNVAGQLQFPGEDFYASACQVTHLSFVPTQLQRFLDYLEQHPLSFKTKHILLGGSQIPTALTQSLKKWGIESYSGYGMTEMASTVFAKKSNSTQGVGQPLSGREFLLVNEEIWLRGAGLAMGYWSEGRLIPLTNEQGWLQTKDRGGWQNDELLILGRLDNMFISGGENIQPEEIEQLILTHDNVEQVFILPISDSEFGQRPVAVIKFKQDFSESAVKDLQDWLMGRLERFKHPVKYFPLEIESEQGHIKVSRHQLKQALVEQLG